MNQCLRLAAALVSERTWKGLVAACWSCQLGVVVPMPTLPPSGCSKRFFAVVPTLPRCQTWRAKFLPFVLGSSLKLLNSKTPILVALPNPSNKATLEYAPELTEGPTIFNL